MANVEITHDQPKREDKREEQTRPERTFRPAVDILETEAGLRLWAELPGVDEGSLEVELVDDVVTIRGRVSAGEYDDVRPVYTEYSVGNYEARFRLADSIDGSRITAKLSNGVLALELPKSEAAKPRRIAIH
jgi:HSP20 family molecular chaperone IbpA